MAAITIWSASPTGCQRNCSLSNFTTLPEWISIARGYQSLCVDVGRWGSIQTWSARAALPIAASIVRKQAHRFDIVARGSFIR